MKAWIAEADGEKGFQMYLERGENEELRYVCFSICEFSRALLPKISFLGNS